MSEKLIKTTIKEQLYQIIKDRIMNHQYALGEKLNMLSLSKELGVSNTPLREALSLLEMEGLVVFIPNEGPSVVDFSSETFHEITEAIMTIELGAYEHCIAHGKRDELAVRLEKQLAVQKIEMEKLEHPAGHPTIEFDACFIKCTNNKYILSMWEELIDIFYLTLEYISQSKDMIYDEHYAILEAVRSGSDEAVRTAIRTHYMIQPHTKS